VFICNSNSSKTYLLVEGENSSFLATQTLSASVADALLYCKIKNITIFKNCDSAITFYRNINNIFDFLNTRNFLYKLQYKRTIYIQHEPPDLK